MICKALQCLSLIALLCISRVALADTMTVETGLYSDHTIVDVALTLPKFDTMGGTRVLLAVDIFGDCWLTSTISGTIKNNAKTTASYYASLTEAQAYLSGPGLVPDLTATATTLYDYRFDIAPRSLLTISPITDELQATRNVTLTTDLDPFIGPGDLSYMLYASGGFNLYTKSNNTIPNLAVETKGGGSIKLVYTYEVLAVPLPTSAATCASLLGLFLLGGYLRRAHKRSPNASVGSSH